MLGSVAHRTLVAVRDTGVVQAALRRRAVRRLGSLAPGEVTVVVTSWNSEAFLTVCLRAVRHFADRPLALMVIDNHSAVSPKATAAAAGARFLRLPANLGHSMALDIGFLTARTEWCVALDVDAFPFEPGWLDTLLTPLMHGKTVVGPDWRGYAHPCALAMRTEHFVTAGHTFAADAARGWDVGEGISRLEGPDKVHLLANTGNLVGEHVVGPHLVGATYEGGLYHNAYGTRHLRLKDPDAAVLDGEVKRGYALAAWDLALKRFGPETWDPTPAD